MSLQIDDSKYPLVQLGWSQSVTDDEVRRVLSGIDGWLRRGEPFGLLIDTRGGLPFTGEQRAMVVEHMKANRAQTERLLAQALVIENPLVRAFYYAVSWAVAMPFPSKVFSDLDPAREWLEQQLVAKVRQKKEAASG